MKILGIAAEYNPFHNGHKYHIEESLRLTGCTHCVAVMSGNFTQRGEPCCLDKWERAALAVKGGVDLVLELPFFYACNGASRFAFGATGILESMGNVQYMSFGSESGDIDKIREFIKRDDSFDDNISYSRNMGISMEKTGLRSDANNILASEYMRNIRNMIPVTVKRCDEGYNSEVIMGGFASAGKIRKMISLGEDISRLVPNIPSIECFTDYEDILYRLVLSEIAVTSPQKLDMVPSAGEGIGYRLKKIFRKTESLESLIDLTRQSRYTKSRIRRVLIQILAREYEMTNDKFYGRILAFNDRGAEILRSVNRDNIIMISNINKTDTSEIDNILSLDIAASDLYNIISGKDLYSNSDMVRMPIKL